MLSTKVDNHRFNLVLGNSSPTDRARLLSVSSPHAASWISVIHSEGLGLQLEPSEFQVAIKWWLCLDFSSYAMCALCPGSVLDPLGHHALTCKRGGDVVSHHNKLRDTLMEACRRAHLSSVLRWRQEATSPLTIATPAQLTSWYPTGLWASQRL